MRRHDSERDPDRGQERLVNGAVDLVVTRRAGETRDQHAHAGESDEMKTITTMKDLPADADRGVAGETDEVADQNVVDDPLEPADQFEHRRPRDLPNRGTSGPSTMERS